MTLYLVSCNEKLVENERRRIRPARATAVAKRDFVQVNGVLACHGL